MATLAEFRAQYPAYDGVSDQQLADALYAKHYSAIPRADFDAKMGIQSVTASAPAEPPAGPDIGTAAAVGRGAAQGLTLGGYDELRGLSEAGGVKPDEPMSLGSLLRGGYNVLTGSGDSGYAAGKNRSADEYKTAAQQYPLSTLGGSLAGTVGSALGLGGVSLGVKAAQAGYGLGGRVLGSILDGTVLGGAQGALSADEGDRLSGAGTGAAIGAGAGLVTPLAVSAASNLFRRAVTPFPTTPQRTAAAQVLEQEGVPLTAGQQTGSRGLRYAESELGGQRASDVLQNQGEAFTNAAMRRAGSSGLASPDNLASLKSSLGNEFEAISSRNTLAADQQMGQDIGTTLNRYGRLLEVQQRPIINNIADDIIERVTANRGALPGPEYQLIRSDLSTAASSTSNQTLAGAFRGMRNALDGAMERSINPADSGRWGQLRREYGNMKTLQRASLGGGEDAGLGIISPARLRMAAATGNPEAYVTGANDFTELAKAGQSVLTPLPQSGTAPRLRAQNLGMSFLPTTIGTVGGSAYGAHNDGMRGAVLGAAAGAALPRLAGRVMMSNTGQRYLANQAMPNAMSPEAQALASLLLGRTVTTANISNRP